MVRVAGLHDQVDAGIDARGADGLSPSETLERIAERTRELGAGTRASGRTSCARRWRSRASGWSTARDCDPDELEAVDRLFAEQIFPVLTPLAVGPGRPFPYISNLSLSLAVWLRDPVSRRRDLRAREGAQGGAAALPADRRRHLRRRSRTSSPATSTSSSPAWRSCATTTSGSPATPTSRSPTRPTTCCARWRTSYAGAASARSCGSRSPARWTPTCAST